MMTSVACCTRLLGVLLLAIALPGFAAAASSVRADSVELSPSVQLVGRYDWKTMPSSTTGQPWSRCLDIVWRAVEAGSSRLNFVPTHHWLPADAANGISAFCVMDSTTARQAAAYDSNSTGTYACTPWSEAVIEQFRDSMALCFTEALRQGLTLYVRPHLDDGTAQGAWRNGLLMQPAVKYAGYSFWDIMLAPLADALREALATAAREQTLKPPPGGTRPVVYFALQGEMSATVVRYASEWAALLPALRQRVLTGASGTSASAAASPADLKLGIGLNFNRLDDTTSVAKRYGSSRLSWLLWQVGATEPPAAGGARDGVPAIDEEGLRELLTQTLDFVGISAYAPYNLGSSGLALGEFENSAFIFGEEMSAYGVDIAALVKSGKLELHFAEFGIGGGGGYGGTQVARTPSEVALKPYFGVYGAYTAARDPWAIPANAAFRREFYLKALQWLASPANTTYRVSGVFIWSMASWDVLGLYPEATTQEGSYRDDEVASAVAAYNRAVRAAAAAGDGGATVVAAAG